MSKYIKLEDAIHNINLEVTGRKEYTGDMKANLFFALDDLPTIEVSEGVIGQGSGDIDWQAVTSTGQEIYAKGYEDGRKSVEVSEDFVKDTDVPISEDCISRADLLSKLRKDIERVDIAEYVNDTVWRTIENAPSVVPTAYKLSAVEDCISKAYLEQELEHYILTEREVKTDIDLGWNMAFDKVFEVIEDVTSATTEQSSIIHCKDCTHYHACKDYAYCTVINVKGKHPQPTDYCSYAEEK